MKCPYCDNEAKWTTNEDIYGKRYGKSYMVYFCDPCNAYVGCHNNSKKPLGTMADATLRSFRVRAHEKIDPLWKKGEMKRKEVYEMLRKKLGKVVHIGESNIETCREIISLKI